MRTRTTYNSPWLTLVRISKATQKKQATLPGENRDIVGPSMRELPLFLNPGKKDTCLQPLSSVIAAQKVVSKSRRYRPKALFFLFSNASERLVLGLSSGLRIVILEVEVNF